MPQTIGAEIPDEIDPYMAEATAVWDEIIEIRFLSEKMQDIIEGRDDGPMLTPVKPKRKKVKTEIIEEEKENSYLPKPTPNTVTDEQIQNHRASLITSFSEQKYADLRSKCKQQNLNTKGKKTELVDRLTEKTLCTEYGSPRMRNSYQTAMNSPLPVAKKDPQPRSLQSQTSMFYFAFSHCKLELRHIILAQHDFVYQKYFVDEKTDQAKIEIAITLGPAKIVAENTQVKLALLISKLWFRNDYKIHKRTATPIISRRHFHFNIYSRYSKYN